MMLITNLYNYFRGYLKIKITGGSREKFINACAKDGIKINGVKNIDKTSMTADVGIRQFRKMREICRISSSRVHILSKKGVPFMLGRLLKREGLICGFLLFVIVITWLCGHIWYIEIGESANVPKEVIQKQLEMCGIYYGAPIRGINPNKVQAEMLNLNPKLSWLWPEVKGTKVTVDLRDKSPKPEIVEVDKPCNIIASESGTVTEVLVKEGRSMVENGMNVAKGQLLVGGIYDSKAIGYRAVHSEAQIIATVNKKVSGTYALNNEQEIPTGNYKKNIGVSIGDNEIFVPIIGKQFNSYIHEKSEYPFKVGNLYFPFAFIKNTYLQTEIVTISYEKEKIIEEAKEYLEKDLQNSVKNGMILEKNFSVRQIDENTVEVALDAVCSMDIAEKQPIEEEMRIGNGDGT